MDLELRRIGTSYGVILPGEVLRALAVKEGDILTLVPSEKGKGFLLTAKDGEFEAQKGIARSLMRRYHDTLRELSK
jgi:putative addiction module antidote